MLTQYTSYDEIRAALGVALEEIRDDVLALPSYEQVLLFDLYDLSTGMAAYYLALAGSLTANQQRFKDLVQVYAAYVLAKHLLISLSMFAPKDIKDAKTEMIRIDDPYAATREGVLAFLGLMRGRVLAAYLVLVPAAVLPSAPILNVMAAIPLGTDPVTGA